MPKAYVFVKQLDSDLPPTQMIDQAREMKSDDVLVCVSSEDSDLKPMVFNYDGPMDTIVMYEKELVGE